MDHAPSDSFSSSFHWVSRYLTLGPRISEIERSMVPFYFYLGSSRVTDSRFSSLRMIIVRDPDETSLSELVLQSWADPCIEGHQAPQRSRTPCPRYRDILRARRSTSTRNTCKESLEVSATGDTEPQTITVVYEVVRMNPYRIAFMNHLDSSDLGFAHPPVIMSDCTYSLDKNSRSLLIYIEPSVPVFLFQDLRDWTADEDAWFRSSLQSSAPAKIPSIMHTFRVTRGCCNDRVHAPGLPVSALHRIALYSIEYEPVGWRMQLLVLGLVSKTWTTVLEMFFELHCQPSDNWLKRRSSSYQSQDPNDCSLPFKKPELPELLAVARSLHNGRPERALLLKKFSLSYYYESVNWPVLDQAHKTAVLSAAAYMISLGRSIKEVDFSYPDFLENRHLIDALSHLSDPETFKVTRHPSVIPIEAVQDLTKGWRNLRSFYWNGSENNLIARPPSISETAEDIELKYNLERLSLSSGWVTGTQFCRFFNAEHSRLVELEIRKIHGLTNYALRTALSTAATTLKQFSVVDCTIERAADEECALDASIHGMCAIELIKVPDVALTSLTVKRKVTGKTKCTARLVIDYTGSGMQFFDDFPAAMLESQGSWNMIRVISEIPLSGADWDTLSQIKLSAESYGVLFQCLDWSYYISRRRRY